MGGWFTSSNILPAVGHRRQTNLIQKTKHPQKDAPFLALKRSTLSTAQLFNFLYPCKNAETWCARWKFAATETDLPQHRLWRCRRTMYHRTTRCPGSRRWWCRARCNAARRCWRQRCSGTGPVPWWRGGRDQRGEPWRYLCSRCTWQQTRHQRSTSPRC